MVGGESSHRAVADQVRAAVAQVADRGVVRADRGGDERGCRPVPVRGPRRREDGVVRLAHRGRERLGATAPRDRGEEPGRKRVDGDGARDLATGDPADAVRDREERRARVLTDDVAILVDLANATGVAAARGPRR